MPFLTQGGIYSPEFLHENNDHAGFGLYNTHGYTRSDDVINQLLLSRAIPGLSFDVIAYVESSPPKILDI